MGGPGNELLNQPESEPGVSEPMRELMGKPESSESELVSGPESII